MDTDRELLELAAKAYGLAPEYVWHSDPFYEGFMRRNFDESGFEIETQLWNPLTDDGDALRLAVMLGFHIATANGIDGNVSEVLKGHGLLAATLGKAELHGDDAYAATRRAIVRAAAAIAKDETR